MKAIHELLRDLRQDRDVKQSVIAELIGTTQQQYSKYENGESELPLQAFFKLADYYGVSADYLAGRKNMLNAVPGLDKKVTAEQTAGEVLSEILSLSAAGRTAVVEYIALQKIKDLYEACEKKKKDGSHQ